MEGEYVVLHTRSGRVGVSRDGKVVAEVRTDPSGGSKEILERAFVGELAS